MILKNKRIIGRLTVPKSGLVQHGNAESARSAPTSIRQLSVRNPIFDFWKRDGL